MRILILLAALALTGCTTATVDQGFDDSRNKSLVKQRIKDANPALKDANINVASYRGVVLVTGEVPSEELIPQVTAAIEPLRNVRRVHNELTVAGKTSLLSRTNDSWLTTKVKTALSADESTEASRIKVVTENAVVYLMGLLTRAEADAAVAVTRDVKGVQKIVTVFDYIN